MRVIRLCLHGVVHMCAHTAGSPPVAAGAGLINEVLRRRASEEALMMCLKAPAMGRRCPRGSKMNGVDGGGRDQAANKEAGLDSAVFCLLLSSRCI